MAQGIVAILFAAWFGRVAHHAGKDALAWAAGGAALFVAVNLALLEGALAVAATCGIEGGGAGLLFVSAWIVSLVAGIAIGVRILPEGSRERLRMEVVVQKARAAASEEEPAADALQCKHCGRSVTKRDALVLGAIRIDDTTCICPGCKGEA